jgi:hypothetical protein
MSHLPEICGPTAKNGHIENEGGLPARAVFQPVQPQHLFAGIAQPSRNFSFLKRPVSGTEVAVEQLCDFFSRARLLDPVQRSEDMFVETAIRIGQPDAFGGRGFEGGAVEGYSFRFGLAATGNGKSGGTGWHELENQSADCVRLVFSGSTRKSIRPLKSVCSQHFHLPILARARTGNRHPPLSCLVAQRVLDIGDNLPCELRIAEILQFDCDSHRTAILSLAASASLLQNARALLSSRTEGAPGRC